MGIHHDDIEPGLAVTIKRQRTRQHGQGREMWLEEFHTLEPATVTGVKRTKSGRVTAIEARNEATRRTYWYTARRASQEAGAPFAGYIRRGSALRSGYELLLERFSA